MKYACLVELRLSVDAEDEDDAKKKAADRVCETLRDCVDHVIAWPDDDDSESVE